MVEAREDKVPAKNNTKNLFNCDIKLLQYIKFLQNCTNFRLPHPLKIGCKIISIEDISIKTGKNLYKLYRKPIQFV